MKGQRMPAEPGAVEEEDLEQTDIHDVLRNNRRRQVLKRLRETEGAQTVRDLSEHVAYLESGEDPPPRKVRQSVYVSLHQTHLPKLDELGIVEYDADAKEVRLAEHADEVTVYLEVVPKYGLSWGEYYLGLGLLGLLLLAGRVVGVPVLATTPTVLLAAVPLVILIASAAYHVETQASTLLDRFRE